MRNIFENMHDQPIVVYGRNYFDLGITNLKKVRNKTIAINGNVESLSITGNRLVNYNEPATSFINWRQNYKYVVRNLTINDNQVIQTVSRDGLHILFIYRV